MKIQVTMKTPDVIYDLIDEAKDKGSLETVEALQEIKQRYFEHGEYLTVEFDTVEETSKALIVG